MRSLRLIARLDIKGPNLIKGIRLEGLRIVGSPATHASNYYMQGVDELIYMDCVASLYGRNHLEDMIRSAAENIFVPMTVGGGVRSVEDVTNILRAGADKVAINTAAVSNPQLISDVANRFGSQCMVLSVEAKQVGFMRWEVYTNNGRERTGMDVKEWVMQGVSRGAGEILLTSVDREGTRKGYDIELLKSIESSVQVPIIASGGAGTIEHVIEAANEGKVDAVAMADIIHYQRVSIPEIRLALSKACIRVRQYES